ncbi:MAG: SHOCT domain-containing protein [Desulfobacteraceae bacterium]|nr:SHOCT domain-containing protein [Desulfobacteraceae bacterium]
MKIQNRFLIFIIAISITGCMSTFGPKIGISEKQWLHRTLIADIVYMEGNIKAYRSSGAYYYFVDDTLVKIDEGMIPPQKIQMEVKSNQDTSVTIEDDKYDKLRKLDELRKDGIITEEEFQVEKQKLLNKPKN